MICGVYKIEFPDGRFYIGSSINIERRVRGHHSDLRRRIHKNYRMQRAFNKHETMVGKELLVCLENDLIFYEQICMNNLKPTLNLAVIAGREAAGRIVSAETRAKQSKARKGRVGTRLGSKASPETLEKLRQSHLRYKPSAETREKLRIAGIGRRHTAEAKLKMSIIAKGKRHTEETKEKLRKIHTIRQAKLRAVKSQQLVLDLTQ